jgi:hypothetical protein
MDREWATIEAVRWWDLRFRENWGAHPERTRRKRADGGDLCIHPGFLALVRTDSVMEAHGPLRRYLSRTGIEIGMKGGHAARVFAELEGVPPARCTPGVDGCARVRSEYRRRSEKATVPTSLPP